MMYGIAVVMLVVLITGCTSTSTAVKASAKWCLICWEIQAEGETEVQREACRKCKESKQ